jgi:uncharacterized protein YgbK (DUF1537 family)
MVAHACELEPLVTNSFFERVIILADDLSGAADCGVAFAQTGLRTSILLGGEIGEPCPSVLSIDVDSRSLPEDEAETRMAEVSQRYAANPRNLIYKKIDSTLRGHLAAELRTVLRVRRETVRDAIAIVAPAFPDFGRSTVNGLHLLHGAPLHESEIWRENQIQGELRLKSILEYSGMRCEAFHLKDVRGEDLLQKLTSLSAEKVDAVLLDAETREDLRRIARVALRCAERAVLVGSAGLAHAMAHEINDDTLRETELLAATAGGPLLFVIGSTREKTKIQTNSLFNGSPIHKIVVSPKILLQGPGSRDWDACSRELEETVRAGKDVLLRCESNIEVIAPNRPPVARAIAELTLSLRDRVSALIVTGGETARKVLDCWNVSTLHLHGEIERGVPISSAALENGRQLIVVTKAGDFGQPDTLLNCHRWLNQRRSISH